MRSILVVCLALILSGNAIGATPDISLFSLSEHDSVKQAALFYFGVTMTSSQVIAEMERYDYVPAGDFALYCLFRDHRAAHDFPTLSLKGWSLEEKHGFFEGYRIKYAMLGSGDVYSILIDPSIEEGNEIWGPYWRFIAIRKSR